MKQKNIYGLSVQIASDNIAPAWTKNGIIYLHKDLSLDEQRVALRHELGHLLLRHAHKVKEYKRNHQLANIAGDAEIALILYTDKEEEIIHAPRSFFRGAIDRKWVKEHAPNCYTFEEIYKHLEKELPPEFSIGECEHMHSESNDDFTVHSSEEIKEVIGSLEKELEKIHHIHKISSQPILKRQKGFNDIVADIARDALIRKKTYRRPSRKYHSKNLLFKGVKTTKTRPRVTVYVDRSGSFTPNKTAMAEQEMRSLAYRYQAKLTVDFLFFSDSLSQDSLSIAGNGTNYEAVVDHIIRTQPRIAVVITDDDSCNDIPELPRNTVIAVKLIDCAISPFAKKTNAIVI